jgi:hypothetical protein
MNIIARIWVFIVIGTITLGLYEAIIRFPNIVVNVLLSLTLVALMLVVFFTLRFSLVLFLHGWDLLKRDIINRFEK